MRWLVEAYFATDVPGNNATRVEFYEAANNYTDPERSRQAAIAEVAEVFEKERVQPLYYEAHERREG